MTTSDSDNKTAIQTAAYLAQPLGPFVPEQVPALMPAVLAPTGPDLIPVDPGFGSQWHLNNTSYPGVDLNVTGVWDDYQGNGVVVGVVDTGIDYHHADLAPNYRTDLDYDARDGDSDAYASQSFDDHGTAVSGVVGAALGNGDVVGVAPGTDITGIRMGFDGGGLANQVSAALGYTANVDVANNSWSYTGFFYDNMRASYFASEASAVRNAATNGRGGLGTVLTFSAGNSRTSGHDVNYHGLQSSRYTVAVGAIESDGDIAYYSTPGAAVLVSAPGSGIYTTDVRGSLGYNSGDYTSINGTSFSAPATAGVVALMLEANPTLGYRDVQEILAYSSTNPRASTSGWQSNGAGNWNGGGLTFSHDYGFGLANAHAAVRLAETWELQSTEANLVTRAYNNLASNVTLPDLGTVSLNANIPNRLSIDHVEVHVHASHSYIGDLVVTLTSPDGTVSTLVDRPGNNNLGGGTLDWDFTSVAHWGEDSQGTWTLQIADQANLDSGTLYDFDLTFYGDAISDDDTYIYTDEWARHGGEAGRGTLSDAGGVDTLNFAAVTSVVNIDLTPGASNTLISHPLSLDADTVIENVYGGDAGDTITGNAAANALRGMRGDDTLAGGAGDDVLTGGAGDDVLDGGAGTDIAVFDGNYATYSVEYGNNNVTVSGGDGTDVISDVETLRFADQAIAVILQPLRAAADNVTALEDSTLTIDTADLLANDVDDQGRAFDIVSVGAAQNGTVQLIGSEITYAGNADFGGIDSFTYTIRNADNEESTATVAVNVTPVADAPSVGVSIGSWSAVSLNAGTHAQGQDYWISESGSVSPTYGSSLARLTNGLTVATWSASNLDGSNIGVFGRLIDAAQNPVGPQFQINVRSTGFQGDAAVSTLGDGFVVSWQDRFADGDGFGIMARRFGSDGSPLGNEFRVNTYSGNDQIRSTVTELANGDFVVVWQSMLQDGDGNGIFGQRYSASGTALGGEIQINSTASNSQSLPRIAGLSNGGFAVTWNSGWQDGDRQGVYGRVFGSDGTPSTDEFRVSDRWQGDQSWNDVSELADGGFVATWVSQLPSGSGQGIFAKRFSAAGEAQGSEFQVDSGDNTLLFTPTVSGLDDGGFMIAWDARTSSGASSNVFARTYSADGSAEGSEFSVGASTRSGDTYPAIVSGNGSTSVAWNSPYILMGKTFTRSSADFAQASLDIAASLADTDGSETLGGYTAAGLPADAILSAGTKNADGTWSLGSGDLAGLTVSVPVDSLISFDLTITATSTESANGDTATTSTTVSVEIGNLAPTADDATVSSNEDAPVAGQLTASDYNGDTLTYTLQADGAHGTVTVDADGAFTYTPDADWSGTDTFTFTVDDGNGGTDTGTVTVDVAPVADAPQVTASLGTWQEGVAAPGVSNASYAFQVNSTTAGEQRDPSIVPLSGGGYVVAWTDALSGGSTAYQVFGQRYDAAGQAVGGEFKIDVGAPPIQVLDVAGYPDLAPTQDGGFVATWTTLDGSGSGVFMQRYDASGTTVGPQVRTNVTSANDQWDSQVTVLSDGGFVVTWTDVTQDGFDAGVFARRFDSTGSPLTNEFQINYQTAFNQQNSVVTPLGDGGFVVVWESLFHDGSDNGIYARRFDSSGQPVGNEFVVNSHTNLDQANPSVALLDDGGFVVTWDSHHQDGSGWGVFGQRFDNQATPAGSEFQVNSSATGDQSASSVIALPGGGFMVAWQSSHAAPGSDDVFGQLFDAGGSPAGSEFRITELGGFEQSNPVLEKLADGRIAVAWQSSLEDGDHFGVFGKLLNADLQAVAISAPLIINATLSDLDGSESLSTITVNGLPAGASLSAGTDNGDGSWTLTPSDLAGLTVTAAKGTISDFQISITATAVEAGNGSSAQTSTAFTVDMPNVAPVAGDTSVITNEDSAVAGQLTARDADGDALTFALETGPANGSVVIGADGAYVYTPDANWFGQDAFTYTVTDGNGGQDTATATVNVAAVNDAPIAFDDGGYQSIAQPITITADSLLANDTDIDGDPLTLHSVGNAQNGIAAIDANGNVVFTPDAGFEGVALFDYTVSDGQGGVATASVSVDVLQPPSATQSALQVDVGGNGAWRLSGSGGQGQLNFEIVDQATGGIAASDSSGWVSTLGGGRVRVTDSSSGSYEYEAGSGYEGVDGFEFRVTDGRGLSSVSRVDVGVGATSPGYDVDGSLQLDDGARYLSLSPSSDGTSLTTGTVSVWVKRNSLGGYDWIGGGKNGPEDHFEFTTDNRLQFLIEGSGGGQLTTTSTYTSTTDWLHVVFVLDSENAVLGDRMRLYVDGVRVTDFAVEDQPSYGGEWSSWSRGSVEMNVGTTSSKTQYFDGGMSEFAYVDGQALDASSFGEDDGSGNWVAKDLSGLSYGRNGFYLDFSDGGSLGRDVSGNGNDFEARGIGLSEHSTQGPAGAPGSVALTATSGHDSLQGTSDADSMDGGDGDDQLIGGSGDDTLSGGAGADTAVYAGSFGDYTVAGDDVSATVSGGGEGTDTLSGVERLRFADRTIYLDGTNNAPVAAGDAVLTAEDTALVIDVADLVANDSDFDGDALTVTAVSGAVNGTAVLGAGVITFTPAAEYSGQASFQVTVSDGNGGTAASTVTVDVASVNDAPVAVADTAATSEDTAVTIAASAILGNDTDVDGDALSIQSVGSAQNGSAAIDANGGVVFTPDADFYGTASFEVTVSDGNGGTATSTVTVDVASVNDAPTVTADTASGTEDTALVIDASSLLADDTDVDGDALSVVSVQDAVGGAVSLSGTTVTFTPQADHHGAASFTYTVSDGNGGTATETVNVTLAAVNDAPVAVADAAATSEDTAVTIAASAILGNDTDVDGDALSIQSVGSAQNGSAAIDANGDVVFTPDADFYGTASFEVTVSDGNGGTATSTVTVDVAAVNDAPVAVTTDVSADEDVPVNGQLSATDAEGGSLTFRLVTPTAKGRLDLNSDGTYVFNPLGQFEDLNEGDSEQVSFTYEVSDGATTTVQSATVTVAGQFEAPIVGQVIDGYIDGATIFGDANGNGMLDDGEAWTTTAADGSFSLVGSSGPLVSIGGTDVSTGLAFEGVMRAPAGATVVTPLTTVMAALVEQGQSAAEAQQTLVDALGLPSGFDIATSDPVQAALDSDPNVAADANLVMAAAIQVQNTVVQAAAVLEGAASLNGTSAFSAVVDALASSLQSEGTNADLSDPTQMQTVLNSAAAGAGIDAAGQADVAAAADEAAAVISQSNNAVDTILASSAGGADLLGSLAQVAVVAQGTAAGDLESALRNDDQAALDTLVTDLSGANLDTAIDAAASSVGDVDGGDVGSSGSDNLTGSDGADVIDGMGGDDTLSGGAGDDRLVGGAGNDQIDGGTGADVAEYEGAIGEYQVAIDGNTVTVTDLVTGNGDEGVDTLTDVERLRFSDRTVHVDGTNNAPLASADSLSTAEDTPLTIPFTSVLANDSDFDGDSLSVTQVGAAHGGTAVLNAGTDEIVFTPDADFYGTASFEVTVSDGNGGTATSTVTVDVTSVNDAPTVTADTASGTEDTALVIDASSLLADDTDVDGDALSVVSVQDAVGGAVSLSGTTVTFTPQADHHGAASFTYTVSDGNGGTAASTVTVDVASVNDAPVAVADAAATSEDTAVTIAASAILGNDTDVDGDALSIQSVGSAQNGSAAIDANGDVVFTPDADFYGTASFEVTVSDGNGGTATSTVTVDVAAVNDAPQTIADAVTTSIDQVVIVSAVDLLANDTDTEGDTLTISNVGSAVNGSVSVNADGDVVFRPDPGYTGLAAFDYSVSDGQGGVTVQTVSVDVLANHAPLAQADQAWTTQNHTVSILAADLVANDTDMDGDTLSIVTAENATNGSVTLNGDGTIQFSPDADFLGNASFDVTVSDGRGGISTTTVAVEVAPPPTASAAALQIEPGATLGWFLSGDGGGSQGLTYSIEGVSDSSGWVSTLGGGRVRVTDSSSGSYEYEAGSGYEGVDGFEFRVTDGRGLSSVSRVDVGVGATSPGYDVDGSLQLDDGARYLSLSPSSDGTSLTTGTVSVWVKRNSLGGYDWIGGGKNGPEDHFEFTTDNRLQFLIEGSGGGQLTTTSTYTSTTDWLHVVFVLDSENAVLGDRMRLYVDGVRVTDFAVEDQPSYGGEWSSWSRGSVEMNVGTTSSKTQYFDGGMSEFAYVDGQALDASSFGEDDGSGNWVAKDLSGLSYGRNGFYLDFSDGGSLGRDVSGNGNDFEARGIGLSEHSTQGPAGAPGSVALTATSGHDSLQGTSDADSMDGGDGDDQLIGGSGDDTLSGGAGADTAVYAGSFGDYTVAGDDVSATVSGGGEGTDTLSGVERLRFADRTIYLDGTNNAPVAAGDAVLTAEDTALVIDVADLVANDSDFDGDALTVTAVSGAVNGTAVLGAGVITFTPAAEYSGQASFQVTVSDGNGGTAASTVTVDVASVNDAPVAVADAAATSEDTAVTIAASAILGNDTDVDGDALSIQSVGSAQNGSAAIDANGDVVFTPDADFYGTASFEVTVSDGNGGTAASTVTVDVASVNDAPTVTADTASGTEDTALVIDASSLLADDTDVDGDALSVVSVQDAVGGAVSLSGTTVTFTPQADHHGAASFTYTVSDGNGGTATETVNVTLAAVNDAPVATADAAATSRDLALVLPFSDLLANDADVDGDSLTITSVDNAINGSVSLDSQANTITFTPDANFTGAASFQYTISDGQGETNSQTVAVDVRPNSAPVAQSDTAWTTLDTPLSIPISSVLTNDSDADGDTITLTSVENGVGGTVSFDSQAGTLNFAPDPGFVGQATFTYSLDDGNGATDTATVTVDVTEPPVAAASAAQVAADSNVTWMLTSTGGDGGLTYSIEGVSDSSGWVSTLGGGRVRVTDSSSGSYEYEAGSGYEGVDGFEFRVTDGRGLSSVSRVDVGVGATSPGYDVDGSLQLDDGARYLSLSPSSDGTSLTTGTVSVWVKRNSLGGYDWIGGGKNGPEDHFEFTTDNRLQFLIEGSGGGQLTTTSTYTSTTDWLHVVFVLDSENAVLGDRMRLYVDGVRVTDFAVEDQPSYGGEWSSWSRGSVEMNVGTTSSKTQYFDGGMSEFAYVDGQALDASSFGEDDGSGNWVAKDLSGLSYGRNGFYLDFSDGGSLGRDVSGNGNDFEARGIGLSEHSTQGPAGAPGSVALTATSGHDSLQGTSDADSMDGGDGDDQLIGGSGDDTLSGGAGADIMIGGTGDDIYNFERGDGADVVDNRGEGSSADKLRFGAGIDTDQLWFKQSGNDLVVDIIGTNDSVTIDEWYASTAHRLASFETDDGSNLAATDVTNLVSAMAALTEPSYGQTELSDSSISASDQTALLSTISSNWDVPG